MEQGVSSGTIIVLEEEDVTGFKIFKSLTSAHFDRLLPKLRIGQHAILLEIWKEGMVCIMYLYIL